MTNEKFSKLFGHKVRNPNKDLTQFHMDMVKIYSRCNEEIILRLVFSISKETKIKNLCMSGNTNCRNGKIIKNIFDNLWFQPVPGDAGDLYTFSILVP